MQTRTIGGRAVGAIGLGAMPMSLEGRQDEDASVRTIHAALDAGVTLIDTADAYGTGGEDTGHNERLVARALREWSGDASSVLIATKGGHLRPGDGSWTLDGRPEYLKQACEASLRRLGADVIGLYQLHRPDPKVPFEESVGALKDLRDEGKIALAGVSNTDEGQIRRAQQILGALASVQNELSPRFRSSEGELRLCEQLGVAFLPWSPLGGIGRAGKLGDRHGAFAEVAAARGVSPQQVALAWMLAKSDVVIPIPGASRVESITDSVRAADLTLTDDERRRLDAA